MNELKELSRRIKENTTVKNEENKNEPEIKNLFENFLSNNSINYLSSLINKTNANGKTSENDKKVIRSEVEYLENTFPNEKRRSNKFNGDDEASSTQDYTENREKDLIVKEKKKKENLESSTVENKSIGHINVKKILQNKKNVEFKDLNKLINSFNDEIMRRSKNLEIFINKNKIKNDYSDKILMIDNFNREMRVIENGFSEKYPLYDLYLTKKKKKKSYDSLIFFKNFFKCLKNYIHFVDKSEKNYKKLKIWKSLVYLRNCKMHILLLKAIFKCVKKEEEEKKKKEVKAFPKEENVDNKNEKATNPQFITKDDIYSYGRSGLKNITPLNKPNEKENFEVKEEQQDNNTSRSSNSSDSHLDTKLMEDLKNIFQMNSLEAVADNKLTFVKDIKMKYDHILNNLKNIIHTIFEKMFVLSNSIKIYKYVYINSNDIFLKNEKNIHEEKISYAMFWHFAYILKIHTSYLEKIKKHLFSNFFKLIVLFYCIVKNINGKEVINNLHQMKHINSLTYEHVKKFVSSVAQKTHVNLCAQNYSKFFSQFKSYLFSESNDYVYLFQGNKEIKNNSFCNFGLSDYIIEHEEYIVIDMENFFSNIFLLLEKDYKINTRRNLSHCEELSLLQKEYIDLNMSGRQSVGQSGEEKGNEKNIIHDSDIKCAKSEVGNSTTTDEMEKQGKESEGTNIFSTLSRCLFEFHTLTELLFVMNKIEKTNNGETGKMGKKKTCPKTSFDIEIEEKGNTDELISIFNFYFNNKQKEESGDDAYFVKYVLDGNDNEKLNHVKDKIKRKYEHVMREGNVDQLRYCGSIFSHYMINKELNENVFTFFHKINMKRNNLREIFDVYYMYRWKKEEKKFDQLVQKIFQKNFFYYLNQINTILSDIFLFKQEEGYILINENMDDYICNAFFDKYNNYNLINVGEVNYHSILSFIEEAQIELRKCVQQKAEKIIAEKNIHSKGVTGGTGGVDMEKGYIFSTGKYMTEETGDNNVSVESKVKLKAKSTQRNICSSNFIKHTVFCKKEEHSKRDEEGEKGEKGEKVEQDKHTEKEKERNVVSVPDKTIISISVKQESIDCLRIHKNLLYIVFTIYRIAHFSYYVLFKIKGEEGWNHTTNEVYGMRDEKNERAETKESREPKEKKKSNEKKEKIKQTIGINTILFCYKIVKYIYNTFLSYSFFIFRFSCFPNVINASEFLLTLINDNIFLKKVLQNINCVFLHYKDLFNIPICEDDIIVFKNLHVKKNSWCGTGDNESKYKNCTHMNNMNIGQLFKGGDKVNWDERHINGMCKKYQNNSDVVKKEQKRSDNSDNSDISDIGNSGDIGDIGNFGDVGNIGHICDNNGDSSKCMKVHEKECCKERRSNKKKKKKFMQTKKHQVLCINKISILKKIYLYIDKFQINLNFFKNMFIKIYKDKIKNLLQKDIIFMDEQFLINTSKIVNLIFEIFQIQDLSKIVHTNITLCLIDYFFFLINTQVYNFVTNKRRIDNNERLLLYDKLSFAQNSLVFVLRAYGGTCTFRNHTTQDENYFLKITDQLPFNLINLKKNKMLFLLLFCKIKYILNSKKGILEMHDPQIIQLLLSNNPYVYDDENYDAILNEFK
ncbi:hypothetical protein, conserved [Plasmodium gonderi]|uniref:Uncharacterized protein n=1 Tax=Plasmodium gonderi TaxID=77519 RepID=A0A1Y1JNN6_PLAGO|nr:hypothetical protein, conserved [Plasmodium gonderi]GAW81674.1 hypothetical protein, conserved [Plasmodium gonderi]